MTDRGKPDAGDEDEALPELCDLCGAVVADSTELYAVVPDSSVVHSVDPRLDGKRMVVGCSREHLAELVERYKHRPFIGAELWAGKFGRAIEAHGGRISPEELGEEAGLTEDQIELGVMWQNLGALRWHQRFGGEGPPQSTEE
ncbi:hypothetical protein [Streptomyces sp. NPDC058486]|uniref:hypothetical protein n=1 Tax=unclassified Streptomyces TaxID=2593676 RepID=UPI0036576C5A